VIRTRARDPLAARLSEIYDGVVELLARHRPNALSVEDVFYAKNVRTTSCSARTRSGAARRTAGRIDIRELSTRGDQEGVVGNGAATKEQVQFMLTRLLRLQNGAAAVGRRGWRRGGPRLPDARACPDGRGPLAKPSRGHV